VLATVSMPVISRPLIAADDDGFWLALGGESGWGRHSTPGLYHLAPGMRRPVLVSRFGQGAMWMIASGHSVWVDLSHYPEHATLLRFDGANATPVLNVSSGPSLTEGENGYGQPSFTGSEAAGLWGVAGPRVIHIDPDTGRATTVARVAADQYTQPPAVSADGALFIADSSVTGAESFSVLYRITPG
jgi:hypothetical protein